MGKRKETQNPAKIQKTPNRKMQNRCGFAPVSGTGVAWNSLRNTSLRTRGRRHIHTPIVHPERTPHNFLEKISCSKVLRHSVQNLMAKLNLCKNFWIQGETTIN